MAVLNFQHLRKKEADKKTGDGKHSEGTNQEKEKQTAEKNQGTVEVQKQSDTPQINGERFSPGDPLLRTGLESKVDDCFCYGCTNTSVDSPGTIDERWSCLQVDGDLVVAKPIRRVYRVRQCPEVKKGRAHREIVGNGGKS